MHNLALPSSVFYAIYLKMHIKNRWMEMAKDGSFILLFMFLGFAILYVGIVKGG